VAVVAAEAAVAARAVVSSKARATGAFPNNWKQVFVAVLPGSTSGGGYQSRHYSIIKTPMSGNWNIPVHWQCNRPSLLILKRIRHTYLPDLWRARFPLKPVQIAACNIGDMVQERTPLRKSKEAVGHAVLALYYYAGA